MEYYSALNKKEILLPETIWINLEGIILSEINKYHRISIICEILNKVKLTVTENRIVITRG